MFKFSAFSLNQLHEHQSLILLICKTEDVLLLPYSKIRKLADTGACKYIKQVLIDIKGEIDNNIIIVGDFNTLLTSMDKSSRQNQ